MKRLLCILIFLIGISGCGSSDDSTPFIPPIVRTFPVKVDITSYAFPIESKNWKYAVSDNISNYYFDNYARANYIVDRLGKANPSDSISAYIKVEGRSQNIYYSDVNYLYVYVYSSSKDKLLYYISIAPAETKSPAALYNSIVEFAIDSIKNYPKDSFSGVVELPY